MAVCSVATLVALSARPARCPLVKWAAERYVGRGGGADTDRGKGDGPVIIAIVTR